MGGNQLRGRGSESWLRPHAACKSRGRGRQPLRDTMFLVCFKVRGSGLSHDGLVWGLFARSGGFLWPDRRKDLLGWVAEVREVRNLGWEKVSMMVR